MTDLTHGPVVEQPPTCKTCGRGWSLSDATPPAPVESTVTLGKQPSGQTAQAGLHGATRLMLVKAYWTEYGTSISEAIHAVDAGWRPGPDPRDVTIAELRAENERLRDVAREDDLRVVLSGAFGEPVHVDPREFLERVLAGLFKRQPDMSGDQRKRLNQSELRAVEDVASCLLTALRRPSPTVEEVRDTVHAWIREDASLLWTGEKG
jgi:hypothetical protein